MITAIGSMGNLQWEKVFRSCGNGKGPSKMLIRSIRRREGLLEKGEMLYGSIDEELDTGWSS